MSSRNRQWVLAARPQGAVKVSDFRLTESPLRALNPGEFRIQVLYLGIAAVMRGYMLNTEKFERPLELGDVMHGRGVGRIVESRNPEWSVGEIVHGKMGWQDFAIADGSPYFLMFKVRQRQVPLSTALGVLGLTGFSAYLGLVRVGALRAGDQVLVSGAAGGVGSLVGQIAHNLGAQAVGIAGGPEKSEFLQMKLGYRAAIDYRNQDLQTRLAELMPEGIDIFFDNVGGAILDTALLHINRHARVVLCGAISQYIEGELTPYPLTNAYQIFKKMARMEAFFIYELSAHFAEAESRMAEWVAEGKLHYQEDVLEGLERTPEALVRLFAGQNIGKQLVRVHAA